ncbi:methyl-accepting chemotaxis protein [Sinisalibacter lacisalsi]|uniref:Methyl-accepting chemotaxis protein n=1 Tax=Sinisalibacter lacisalsi TaxID=1526570 RepID=A0ABQ1QKI1_9RHOB|nr:methyl-accepting chemotaxis protein [Sinisalibacter lacisalsi]GGD31459.1 hypothetical protein GCM10011358_14360 [Sinisalibacter lacisalsi]
MQQNVTKPHRKIRWNSVFLKLSGIIWVSAMLLTAVLAWHYTRANLASVQSQLSAEARSVTDLLAEDFGEQIMLNTTGLMERRFLEMTGRDEAAMLHALAISADGAPMLAIGLEPAHEAALRGLAARAIETGGLVVSDDGLMVAAPAHAPSSGVTVGAIATSWTAQYARAAVLKTQVLVVSMAFGAIFLGVAVMFLFIRHWITRPMLDLARAVDAVAEDELDRPVAMAGRKDEIGDIATSVEYCRKRLCEGREHERLNRFRGAAFRASSAAIMMVDRDLRITAVNQKLKAILQERLADFRTLVADFEPESVIGREMDDFHTPELRERVRAILFDPARMPYKAHIRVGEARFELMITQVAGADGALEGFVVEWVDVTVQYMNDAILSAIDAHQVRAEFSLDGTLLSSNAEFAKALGADPQTLVGASSDALFAFDTALDDARGTVFDRLRKATSVYGSFDLKRADGGRAVIEGSFTPVLDKANRLIRTVLIGNDVSEARHQLEQAETERQRQAEAQARVVDALRNGLGRLAEGDLTQSIDEPFPEDYEQLRRDFNGAVDRLHDAMRGVVENADLIRGEAAEISNAADDLSVRTERQAATLEQTAAALDQLTSSVKSAAGGAEHANGLVDTARKNAESSGEVVRGAVEAMSEIETSSQEISKITGVIDDIAFQTNLLALNAGVEAARAGDAGRGFAVVASEVRALAQRSSDAAREINGLISASGQQVQRGVELVDRAGEALRGILESVTEISRNVSEIAVSSREQSAGLAEINEAVNQLDQVTQQNAAMFEQTTAASHALTREAETLTASMARFELSRAHTGGGQVVEATFASRRSETKPPKAAAASGAEAMRRQGGAALAVDDEDEGWDEF